MEHYTKTLPYELELTSRVLHEATRCFFELQKFPISQEEFIILDCLYINPNIIQMEIAKLILKGRAHTGKFLKSLEEKKLITRTPVKQGSKIVMQIKITDKGLKTYRKIANALDEHIKDASAGLKIRINDVIYALQTIREDAVTKFNIKFE